MPPLTDNLGFVEVDRIEVTDIALGGNETNTPNKNLRQLASRDKWLYDQLAALLGLGDEQGTASYNAFRDTGMAAIAQGRLTVATGDPDPVGDQVDKETLFYTPYLGDRLAYWNGADSRWEVDQFAELSLPLTGFSANTNYDIFLTRSSSFGLEAVAWSDSAAGVDARSQALSRRNGVLVKTADNRRYLGTIRTTTAGKTEDSQLRRFVWNAANRLPKSLLKNEFSGIWTYAGTGWRPWNNSTANRIEVVLGRSQALEIRFVSQLLNDTSYFGPQIGQIGIGHNSTTIATGLVGEFNGVWTQQVLNPAIGDNLNVTIMAALSNPTTPGYHYFQTLEQSFATPILFDSGIGVDLPGWGSGISAVIEV